jgi:hypothetical protein
VSAQFEVDKSTGKIKSVKRQSFRSQYGRPSISVSAACPTYALKNRLSRTHVGTSFEEVEAMVREAAAAQREAGNVGWTVKMEAEAVRFALWRHAENRAEYGWVMGSH